LIEALRIVKDVEDIGFVYFDETDVVRHRLVQQIVKAYDAAGARRAGDGSV
jgi:phosphate starvation-inducible PhoH-like protein